MLRISIEEAEKIKIKYASAKASLSSQKLKFEIPNSDDNQMISENELSQYVEARMEEIFQLAFNEIKRAGIDNNLTYGVVLTGGGSQLRNIVVLANELLDMPIRLGRPINHLLGNKEFADEPVHSKIKGLLLWPLFSNEQKNIQHSAITFFESIKKGAETAYYTLTDYMNQMKYLASSEGASQLGGFGTIGSIFPAQWNWKRFWEMTAFLSIILAFMNFLPIPALDGGHIMFVLYEMFSGKKPSDKFLEYAHGAGFILLISLFLYANGMDLIRAFS
mgnify:CR=1 FL=1